LAAAAEEASDEDSGDNLDYVGVYSGRGAAREDANDGSGERGRRFTFGDNEQVGTSRDNDNRQMREALELHRYVI